MKSGGESDLKIQTSWLTERVDDAPTFYDQRVSPASALQIRTGWQQLKNKMQAGDELWTFSSPAGRWSKAGKHSGFALVRNGSIVEVVSHG